MSTAAKMHFLFRMEKSAAAGSEGKTKGKNTPFFGVNTAKGGGKTRVFMECAKREENLTN